MNTEYYKDCFVDAMRLAADMTTRTIDDSRHLKYVLDIVERGVHDYKLNVCYAKDFYENLSGLYNELFGDEWDSPEDYTVE